MGWLKRVAASIACVFSAVTYAGDEPARAASAALAHGVGSVRPRTAHYEPTPKEAAILRKIAAADAEPGRLARCLRYPDPPDTHWNQASVAILCHMQFDPMPTLAELRQKLDKESPASLDRYFDDLRKAQARPETSWKLDLVTTLRLNCACKEGRDLADAWLARSPDSVWANLASGLQFEGAAVAERGTGFAQETGAERFARMRAMDAKAKAFTKPSGTDRMPWRWKKNERT